MREICLTLVILLHFAGSIVINKSPEDKDELVSVVVLYRHGDRSPKESFPNDKFFNATYWPMGFGQLTKFGINRQYHLGKWLRTRYDAFLGKKYSPEDIYVYSTDKDRTLMSAAANLAGLYPPVDDQIWNQNIPWQPIPIHSSPRDKDDVIVEKRDCPLYDKLYKKTKNSEFFLDINKKYVDLYDLVSNYTGWHVKNLGKIKTLQSNIYAYRNYNVTFIPTWTKYLNQTVLEYLSGLAFQRYTYTVPMKRLRTGPFFNYLFTHFDNIIGNNNNSSATKFLMISGHDTSLSSILNSMGVFDLYPPNFAATVIWELKRSVATGLFYVNLYYRKSENQLEQLRLKGCGLDCNYEDFKEIMAPTTVEISKWTKECFNDDNDIIEATSDAL